MYVLFIGNSFTGRNDVPAIFAGLATATHEKIAVTTDAVLANGASLRLHWNAGAALEKIQERRWDFVVLQEQSTLPIKNAKRFHENVRLFDNEIKKSGTRTALYLTWARQAVPETQVALNEATQEIARETGALIVPVGLAWTRALTAMPSLRLYDKDGSHPSPVGSLLAASVLCKALCGVLPDIAVSPRHLGISCEDFFSILKIVDETVSL